jgi:hypothetical protein
MIISKYPVAILWFVLAAGFFVPSATGQTTTSSSQHPDETTITGTVISSSRNTLVVRTPAGVHQLFVFDSDTVKPAAIAVGSEVSVRSTPTGEPGVRLATAVAISSAAATTPSQPPPGTEVVPASVRQLERDIERQSRRYGLGVRAGMTLDPELISVGLHARLGPFFDRDIAFRPNVEFAFGEITKLFAINLEGVYRLPISPRTGRWSSYVGLGPSFVFSHQDFEEDGIDFGDFEFDGGLNVLAGVSFRSGVFMEIKSTVWASPHLRFIFGYSF